MSIPDPVLAALLHVREYHPQVTLVVFNRQGQWCYMDEDFDGPIFGDEIDVDILQKASDCLENLPACFELPTNEI